MRPVAIADKEINVVHNIKYWETFCNEQIFVYTVYDVYYVKPPPSTHASSNVDVCKDTNILK